MNVASRNCILLVCSLAVMVGCAGSAAPESPQAIGTQQVLIADRVDSLEKEMLQWRQMQPSVARLVVIESDLKELIIQLGAMVEDPELAPALEPEVKPAVEMMQAVENPVLIDVKQAQEPTPDVIALSEPASQQPKVQTAAAYPSAPEQPIEVSHASTNGFLSNGHLGGKYALQLSSVTNPWVIESFWLKLQKKYASALEGVTPTYERASVKGKTYFRIKVGQFSKKKQATQACAQLKNIGGSCVVTLNNGVTYPELNKRDL